MRVGNGGWPGAWYGAGDRAPMKQSSSVRSEPSSESKLASFELPSRNRRSSTLAKLTATTKSVARAHVRTWVQLRHTRTCARRLGCLGTRNCRLGPNDAECFFFLSRAVFGAAVCGRVWRRRVHTWRVVRAGSPACARAAAEEVVAEAGEEEEADAHEPAHARIMRIRAHGADSIHGSPTQTVVQNLAESEQPLLRLEPYLDLGSFHKKPGYSSTSNDAMNSCGAAGRT